MTLDDEKTEKKKFLLAKLQQESLEVDRRLTWMCQLQGFLFAALCFAWDKAQYDPFILFLISALGLSAAALVFKSLLAISRQEHVLVTDFDKLSPDFNIKSYYPNRENGPNYRSPQNVLPFVFVVGWLSVLVNWTLTLNECFWYFVSGVIVLCIGFFIWREICLARKCKIKS